MVFASLNLLPNTPCLLRGAVLLCVIRPCTQSYVGLVIFAQEDYGAVSGWGAVTKGQRDTGCMFVCKSPLAQCPRLGGEMVGLETHVGSAPLSDCLGPGVSKDNG